jgi:ankyrin repeat protein
MNEKSLEKKANVDSQNNFIDKYKYNSDLFLQSQTPLMRAAKRGFVEAVQTLLKANARTDIRDREGYGISTRNERPISTDQQ